MSLYILFVLCDILDGYKAVFASIATSKDAVKLRQLGTAVTDLVRSASDVVGPGIAIESGFTVAIITLGVFFSTAMVENLMAAAGLTTSATLPGANIACIQTYCAHNLAISCL